MSKLTKTKETNESKNKMNDCMSDWMSEQIWIEERVSKCMNQFINEHTFVSACLHEGLVGASIDFTDFLIFWDLIQQLEVSWPVSCRCWSWRTLWTLAKPWMLRVSWKSWLEKSDQDYSTFCWYHPHKYCAEWGGTPGTPENKVTPVNTWVWETWNDFFS